MKVNLGKGVLAPLLILFMLGTFNSQACDICNVYVSTSFEDEKSNIEFIHRFRLMHGSYNSWGKQILTKHASHGNDPNFWGKEVFEYYNTLELRGSFVFKKRFRTTIVLPFTNNSQYIGAYKRYNVSGISDPLLMQEYLILDRTDCNWRFKLNVGAGIKSPIGKTSKLVGDLMPNLDLQPGTGSWDFIALIKSFYMYKTFGIVASSSYRKNGRNKEMYKYGDGVNSRIDLFNSFHYKSSKFMPYLGYSLEFAMMDKSFITHEDTGAKIHYMNSGFKMYVRKNLIFFCESQYALKNDLNGNTQLLTRLRINSGVQFRFNKT